jgi:hypothetical protein
LLAGNRVGLGWLIAGRAAAGWHPDKPGYLVERNEVRTGGEAAAHLRLGYNRQIQLLASAN